MLKEASYYSRHSDGKITCNLCPHNCVISPGKTGRCGVRTNREGTLYSDVYERKLACNLDPIEKKPLYHFHPGRQILSIGTRGCSMRCDFCQNWEMFETSSQGTPVTSDKIAQMAGVEGSIGVAYTYNEPLVWYEFVLECAVKVRRLGLKNVLVTNGFINPEPMEELLHYIDAMNIDLKSMNPDFYRKTCKAELAPVLETIRLVNGRCHLEVTNLIIPTLNDSDSQLGELVDFVSGLGDEIPLHFSTYYPCYKLSIEPTTVSTLKRAADIAGRKLKYVYLGNVRGTDFANSYCPACGNLLIERAGYMTDIKGISGNRCGECGNVLPFIV